MNARILLGREIQRKMLEAEMSLAAPPGVRPRCRMISVAGTDPMLEINRTLHVRTLEAAGLACEDVCLPAGSSAQELIAEVEAANHDRQVHGVMVLMPLPGHLSVRDVLPRIDPDKELEGLHPQHVSAMLATGRGGSDAVLPLVPEAVLTILDQEGVDLADKHVVILTEAALMNRNPVANLVVRTASAAALPATGPLSLVPIEHPRARELARCADVLVVSLEHAEAVGAEYVAPGAVVIDFNPTLVGLLTRADGSVAPDLRGGVDTAAVRPVASLIVPVPGGAGPVMLGILMRNLIRSARRSSALTSPA